MIIEQHTTTTAAEKVHQGVHSILQQQHDEIRSRLTSLLNGLKPRDAFGGAAGSNAAVLLDALVEFREGFRELLAFKAFLLGRGLLFIMEMSDADGEVFQIQF